MSDSYKFGFDEAQDDDFVKKNYGDDGLFQTAGSVRNLDLVWPSGERQFFNYAYLVSCKFIINPEEKIFLVFTTDTVAISGIQLHRLYLLIREHSIKVINCIDERYNDIAADRAYIVNTIEIFKENP